MSYLLDSSVLVPALAEDHPRHGQAFSWVARIATGEIDGTLVAHTLAETYSVLTRLPVSPRIPPGMAWRLIRENTSRMKVVSLSATDYRRTIAKVAELGLAGGVIYDALIASVADRLDVTGLLTFNARDFRRVWPEGRDRIVEP